MEIINKVANSGLITIDLEEFFPLDEIVEIDLKTYLFQELILKEKDFRAKLLEMDWNTYNGKLVALYCSNDAIIPNWAYMLLSTYLLPHAKKIVFGSKEELEKTLILEHISQLDVTQYQDSKIVIKGCSKHNVPLSAYVQITNLLMPYAKSIMYGEPCSTVPIYKRPK